MAKVVICGLGPGGLADLTEASVAAIERCPVRFLRTARHPTAHRVVGAVTFDHLYETLETFDEIYQAIAAELKSAALHNTEILYAVPGSPMVLERSVRYLIEDPDIDVELVPALSFMDVLWTRLGIDPISEGVRLVDGHSFASEAAGERGPLLVAHAHAKWVLSDIKLAVEASPNQTAIICKGLGTDDEEIVEVPWAELDRSVEPDHLTSLYIAELANPVAGELLSTVELMHRLRTDCPWDAEQTHVSLRRHLLEEAYEVLEAIDGLDIDSGAGYEHLEEELGDLWFQILFHAELATEAGQFSIADVARGVHDKLVGRHPHVFGGEAAVDAQQVMENWEHAKIAEKGRVSVMDGIPKTLPALTLAEKVLKKASRAGGASTTEAQARAGRGLGPLPTEEAVGAVLLAIVEQARAAGVDPEGALRAAATQARDRFMAGEAAGVIPASWVFG